MMELGDDDDDGFRERNSHSICLRTNPLPSLSSYLDDTRDLARLGLDSTYISLTRSQCTCHFIINVKINVALSENASRTRYTIKIKLKLRK